MNRTSIIIPPVKSQGIKTKLIPFIKDNLPEHFERWIEPFMGTGVVGFNLARGHAVMSDVNQYIIQFYKDIQSGFLTSEKARAYLERESEILKELGDEHYYIVRKGFNEHPNSYDFLFLTRSCFNGVMRFNGKGEFNTPFCKKRDRFSKAYITKIINQIKAIENLFKNKTFEFYCQPFEQVIGEAGENDLIYCDPPYIGRNTQYYKGWDEDLELKLFDMLKSTSAKFMLSTWLEDASGRRNEYVDKYWKMFNIESFEHFYHVGSRRNYRKGVTEIIVKNF